METVDVIIIQMYLLALFATAVKAKTSTAMYRLLKLFVVVFFAFVLIEAWNALWSFHIVSWVKVAPLVLILIIMVRTEIRLMLNYLGIRVGLLTSNTIEENVKEAILKSVAYLSKRKIGALITFERDVSLDDFIQPAFPIHAPVSAELLSTIFVPTTPLHDGAVIIKGNEVICAGTYFPPTERGDVPKYLGSRHRAAIGISEATDALTVIISEETGFVSVAVDGYLDQDISNESLVLYLEKYLQN